MHPVLEEFAEKIKNEILETVSDRLKVHAAEREQIEADIKTNKQNFEKFHKEIVSFEMQLKELEVQRTAALAAGKSPLAVTKKIRETREAIADLSEMVESLETEILPALQQAKNDKSYSMGLVIENAALAVKERYVSRMNELIQKEIEPFLLGWNDALGKAYGAYWATVRDFPVLRSIYIKSRVVKDHIGGFGQLEPSIYQK